ncbi:metallopeptidase TldD-related protein, partial [Escherichia coli]|uniref:metallopeptidase TldD-related protein n=1 Tax=Escherichia coli TaxID=562 RepID=UPI00227EA61B
MTNTYMLPGKSTPQEIIESVEYGIYAPNFGGGQVDITSGKFVFSTSEAYLIENGKVTKPVKGATLIGSGIETMQQISMVGNDLGEMLKTAWRGNFRRLLALNRDIMLRSLLLQLCFGAITVLGARLGSDIVAV